MSDFCQFLAMVAVPAGFLLTIRHLNIRADRAFDARLGNETRPTQ